MSASSSIINNPAPATATQAGATDPDGNLQPLLVDADGALITSGGGGSGGSAGPTGDPVPADATYIGGSNSGTLVGIKVGSDGTVAVSAASLPLPSGAATEATLSTLNGKVTACNTGAVVVSSSALPSGAATESTLSTLNGKVPSGLTVTSTRLLVDASGTTQPVSGTVTVTQATGTNLHAVIDSGTITTVSTVTTVSAVTSITNTVATKEIVASTATLSNVASSATSVTVLASNANRLGAMVANDSTQPLFLKFGATASSSSFTVALGPGAYYELPTAHIYTGIIDGIWSSANGNARVTELTA